MAVADVHAFFEKVEGDSSLQQQLKAVASGGQQRDEAVAEIVKIAAAAGFAFTLEELQTAANRPARDEELSDEELKAVAGAGEWGEECEGEEIFMCPAGGGGFG